MKHYSLYLLLLTILLNCQEKSDGASTSRSVPVIDSLSAAMAKIDLSSLQYIVFLLDTGLYSIFPKNYRPSTLQEEEIKKCEVILIKYIEDYNRKALKRSEGTIKRIKTKYPQIDIDKKQFTINQLASYGRQYLAVLTPESKKIVYLNAFCDPEDDDYWKKDWVCVYDGGNCFFQLKIDLQTNQVIEFRVNGLG